ncbi:HvfC/BufC family peptide modification chaperone [Tabrizicola sp.]|uniref:HvfC/BufC family peptide modification chaperone n=1 Tax=Tabrizicola sp. TaxID=2005166 RepID=UPI003F33F9F8
MNEHAFAEALLNPDAAVPEGIVDPMGRAAPKRFSVYRNNVASSLTRALEAAFPTVRKLVGDEFFAAMAGVFLRAHPPQSRMLMLYGDAMPGFLEAFQPVAHLGYLPDVARLDQAMRESYHSADSAPLDGAAFQRLLGEDLAALRLTLAPSVRLVRSRWPIVSIWAANAEGGPAPRPGAEDALILRPDFDPRPQCLPAGGGAFVAGLLEGHTLGASIDLAGPTLDLPAVLGLLISGRAITGVSE